MLVSEFNTPRLSAQLLARLQSWDIHRLTDIQRLALEAGVAGGKSLVVCAPTSSGKTLVGEIAIYSALQRRCKCLYLVSHKALADQKYVDFEQRFGSGSSEPLASVGLSTGDREEGDVSPQIMVATYEKGLSLLLSGQLDTNALLVVADELQIMAEEGRGPNIETLCAIFRQRKIDQFVALTATVGNAQELADWLDSAVAISSVRDVVLHQEIWNAGQGYVVQFGKGDGEDCHVGTALAGDTLGAVRQLIAMGRGPVLVFTESRGEATDLSTHYSQALVQTADGIAMASQLELYSEPTESSQQLQQNAQRRVTFHSADLTSQERQVIEQGFANSSFDACFATSTLAAGVNFPFRSVVFPKLTYQWGDRGGRMIALSDYRNMSGRAGRLGLHDDGFAILLPRNPAELAHANRLVLPENENLESKMVRLSMRRTVLSLVASRVVNAREALTEFFQNTLYWHQIQERNPRKLDDVIQSALRATDWLTEHRFIEEDHNVLLSTPVGKAVAWSGLLPTTAVQFLDLIATNHVTIDQDFEAHIVGLIHWACSCDEFAGPRPSRFLPWPIGRTPVHSTGFLQSHALLTALDRTDGQTNQCAHALILFCQGEAERSIRHQTNISSGQIHRLATEIAWIFDGLRRIISVPDLGYPQTLTNKMSMLARQIQWGAPTEALDILRVAERQGVPGFGRQRAMALLRQGIETFDQLLSSSKEALSAAVGNEGRARALLKAVAACFGIHTAKYQKTHAALAAKLGCATQLASSNDTLGTDYEKAVQQILMIEQSWTIHLLDDGKQQNVPDLLIVLGDIAVIIECKTTSKNPPLIKKEEAFAVMQKAIGYDAAMHRVTLGKPGFDEHSKKKVQTATDVALVSHDLFVEGLLRVHAKEITPQDFLKWLAVPGLTELDRLGGRASYEILYD
jgi:helicase